MKQKNQLSHEINLAGTDAAKDAPAKTLLKYRKAMSEVGANLFEFYIDVADEKGFNRGLEQGREEGIETGIIQLIKKMVSEGASDEMILRYTCISHDLLERIKNIDQL